MIPLHCDLIIIYGDFSVLNIDGLYLDDMVINLSHSRKISRGFGLKQRPYNRVIDRANNDDLIKFI